MAPTLEREIKVGLFVTLGVGLLTAAVLLLGSTENMFDKRTRFITYFPNVDGLIVGAKVALSGVSVGTVQGIEFDTERRSIKVTLAVIKEARPWLRGDSLAQVSTQGMLGDKYVVLDAGSPEQPELPEGAEIANKPSQDMSQFLTKGDQLVMSANSIAKTLDEVLKKLNHGNRADSLFQGLAASATNLAQVSAKLDRTLEEGKLKASLLSLNSILEKMDRGKGTAGALINDPGVYDDLKALTGGANRNRIVRNLVRKSIKDRRAEDAEDAAEAAESAKSP